MTIFRWYNFGGGLQRTSNDYLRQDDQTKVSVNVKYDTTGSITKRNGYTRLGVIFTTTSTSTTTTSTSTSISTSTTSTSTTSTSTTWTDSTTSTSSTTTSISTSSSTSTTSTSISTSTTSTSITTTSSSTSSTSTSTTVSLTTSTSTTTTSTSTTTTSTSSSSSTTTLNPSGSVDQESLSLDNVIEIISSNPHGQSFTASRNGAITNLALKFGRVTNPSDQIYVHLYSDSAGYPGTKLDEADNTTNALDYMFTHNFAFTSGYSLVSGTKYHIVFGRTGATDSDNFFESHVKIIGTYGNGNYEYYNGSSWVATNSDIYFKEYSIT